MASSLGNFFQFWQILEGKHANNKNNNKQTNKQTNNIQTLKKNHGIDQKLTLIQHSAWL
jgi:hypothetical protein